jgi:NADH:ubiquinone oxidoreductase subunit D
MLPHMAKGTLIADLIASTAMLDPILGGIDR